MGFLYLRYFDGSWIKKLSNTLGRELHPKQESKEVRYFELRWFDQKKIKTYTARKEPKETWINPSNNTVLLAGTCTNYYLLYQLHN